jgi:hypothetical protein
MQIRMKRVKKFGRYGTYITISQLEPQILDQNG